MGVMTIMGALAGIDDARKTIDFGGRGVSARISVDERVEVPWGIRSDAPMVPPAA
jgi:hypothetical protein